MAHPLFVRVQALYQRQQAAGAATKTGVQTDGSLTKKAPIYRAYLAHNMSILYYPPFMGKNELYEVEVRPDEKYWITANGPSDADAGKLIELALNLVGA